MSIIALVSASGAPGVTTTALGLALTWPRPVLLLEADPSGGSAILAGWFHGRPPHHRGLVDLAAAHGTGEPGALRRSIGEATIRLPGTSADLIAGIRSPAQGASVAQLWPALAEELRSGSATRPEDLIIDAGRLGMQFTPWPLIDAADLVLLVSRATLPAVAAARGWGRELHERFAATGTADRLGLLLVGPGHTFSTGEVRDALGLPVLCTLPWDPRTAQAIHLGEDSRRLAKGALAGGLSAATLVLGDLAGRRAAPPAVPLAPDGDPAQVLT